MNLRPGLSIFEQVVFAAKKAFISGEFVPGQAFPSVRALAVGLKIHPNTAHKVVQYLIQQRLLGHEIAHLVVEAKRARVALSEVIEAIEAQWGELDKSREARQA